MTAFETLLEAIEYANSEDSLWWEYFESKSEAKETLNEVSNSILDEYDVINLADALGEDVPLDTVSVNNVTEQCLKILKRKL